MEISRGEDCVFNAPKDYTFGCDTKLKGVTDPQVDVNVYQQPINQHFRTLLLQGDEGLLSKQPKRLYDLLHPFPTKHP